MELRQDYIERLKKLEGLTFNNWFIKDKRIHHIGDFSRGNLYEDVVQIDFNALYPSILIGLFEADLLEEKWKEDIDRVKWFLKNRKELKLLSKVSGEYEKWKIHCNSLYTKIQSPYVVEYMNIFYSDLIDKYGNLIIYIDVDLLILKIKKEEFQTKEIIKDLSDFSYNVTFINYFYAEDLAVDQVVELTTDEPDRKYVHSQLVEKPDGCEVTPLLKVFKSRKGGDWNQYWFRTENGLALVQELKAHDSMTALVDSLFRRPSLRINAYIKATRFPGPNKHRAYGKLSRLELVD